MKNESGIKPVGHRILVLPAETERKTSSGLIMIEKVAMMEEMAQTQGTIVSMGDTCFEDEVSPWCKEGDFVMFGKYAGVVYQGQDEKQYRILNDKDVVAVITKKGK
ncbi:MAG: hypothetical protein JHC33_05605 [Ignisphaera sp.]|jgi:co-chaperonin GroES (HSP10)|nr:hypothetical protein [Ignisphaera sp.]